MTTRRHVLGAIAALPISTLSIVDINDKVFDEVGEDFASRFIDFVIDVEYHTGHEVTDVNFTLAAFKQAMVRNLIDYIADDKGRITVPVFLGRRVHVVGAHPKSTLI